MIRICAAFLAAWLLLEEMPFACAAPRDPIVIGVMAELSGPYAANGRHCREGYELARRLFAPDGAAGAHAVVFQYGDTRGEAREGIAEFQRLTGVQKAVAVVTTRSSVAMPLNPLSRQKQIPLLTTIGHADFIRQNPYGYRFWPSAERVGQRTAHEIIARDLRRAAVVSIEDEFTLSLAGSFKREFKRLGGATLLDEKINESEGDFSTLAAKVRSFRPDLVFLNLGLVSTGLFVKKLREQGVAAQIAGNSWMTEASVAESAGVEAIEGAFFVDFDFRRPVFLRKMGELFPDSAPVAVSYACYAALGTLLQTLSRHPEVCDSRTLHQALLQEQSVPLLDGELKIRGREAELELVVKTLRRGQLE
jgi:branched-chain amino acid transport system substrate-binding protein